MQSMSRRGSCIGNGATEQVFGHLKDEFFRNRVWPSFDAFRRDFDAYVIRWNTRRWQVRLKGLTPEEFRNQSLNVAWSLFVRPSFGAQFKAVHAGPYRTVHRFGKRLQHCLQQCCSSECNSPVRLI